MPHVGNKPGDRSHCVWLLEGPVDDLHHPVVILREPVVARLELLDGHVLRIHDHRAARVLRVVSADDPALLLEFPIELGPRIGDQDVDRDAVDLHPFQGLDGPVEHIRRVGVESEDDPPVHEDAVIVEPRDVVLETLDPVEPFVRLGKSGCGNRLDSHKDTNTARLGGQGEQLLVFREEDMGLHKELFPKGDHRREKLLRKGLVGRHVVVQEGNEPVARPQDVGDDMADRTGPESQAVDVSCGAKGAGMGAAPRRLDRIEREIPGDIEQIQPGRFQPGQVNRRFPHIDALHPSGHCIGDNPRPHFVSLSHHHRVGMLQPLFRHDRGMHPAQDHRHMPLPVMIGNLIGAVGPEHLEGDPHEIGMVVQADRLHPFVLDGNLVPFRRGRRHRGQGKGHDLRPF